MNFESVHVPVMPDEVLATLALRPGETVVDGTLGGGGHTRLLVRQVAGPSNDQSQPEAQTPSPNQETQTVPPRQGQVIALDRDPAAIARAETELRGLPIKLAQADYCELPQVLKEIRLEHVDAVLLDLGLSSDQLADSQRGFSFDSDGPLDLRFDPDEGEPAWRLLERLSETDLANLIYEYGEERLSRRIARQIVARRRDDPVRDARQLADLIRRLTPGRTRIHPATRTFQALRIAVNHELRSLDTALAKIPDCLRPGGRLAIISFHSLEDRRVKQAFRDDPRLDVLTRRPVVPSETEIDVNPRVRSAKLRAAARV